MTMPTKSNCAHSPDGWCLPCVQGLQAQLEHSEKAKSVRDDLAMLVRLLIRKVRKVDPNDETARKALDFLTRHNLQGSVLREE